MRFVTEGYTRVESLKQVYGAKLHHQNNMRCIFRCKYPELASSGRKEEGETVMGQIPMMREHSIAQADHWSASAGVLSSFANRFLSIDFS
jgi:hypothetical protein